MTQFTKMICSWIRMIQFSSSFFLFVCFLLFVSFFNIWRSSQKWFTLESEWISLSSFFSFFYFLFLFNIWPSSLNYFLITRSDSVIKFESTLYFQLNVKFLPVCYTVGSSSQKWFFSWIGPIQFSSSVTSFNIKSLLLS